MTGVVLSLMSMWILDEYILIVAITERRDNCRSAYSGAASLEQHFQRVFHIALESIEPCRAHGSIDNAVVT